MQVKWEYFWWVLFSVILGSCLKWVKNLMLYFLFIPIIPITESYVMCTEECFLIVSLQGICYIWTQTAGVLLHTDIYFKCQDYLFQMPWLHNKGETLHGAAQLKQRKRRWKLSSIFWKCVGVQRVSSSTGVGGISIFCWEFFEQKSFLKVASQLLSCTVTFSSRKYSESYQMLLGVQHGTTLSSLVIVQLFPHGGILANLSILRTRKYN